MDEPLRPPDDLGPAAGACPQHADLLRHRLHDDRGPGRAGHPRLLQGTLLVCLTGYAACVSYKVRCWCVLQGMLLVSLTRYAAGVSYRVPTGPGILEMSWNLK